MRGLVKDCSKQGITLGGRKVGSLTEVKIKKLTGYYGKALRRNKGSVEGMKAAIFATVYHNNSTDAKSNHSLCPSGEESWCFYQSAISKGRIPGPHAKHIRTPLNDTVVKHVLPIYTRLSSDVLLQLCVNCNTQNANESLHSRIWRICPKDFFFRNIVSRLLWLKLFVIIISVHLSLPGKFKKQLERHWQLIATAGC